MTDHALRDRLLKRYVALTGAAPLAVGDKREALLEDAHLLRDAERALAAAERDLAAAVAERGEQAALAETRKQSRSMYRERAENAERDLAAAREALRALTEAAERVLNYENAPSRQSLSELRAVLAAGGGEEPT